MQQRAVGVLADAAEVSSIIASSSSPHTQHHQDAPTTTLHRPGSAPAAAAVTGAHSQHPMSASYHRFIFAGRLFRNQQTSIKRIDEAGD